MLSNEINRSAVCSCRNYEQPNVGIKARQITKEVRKMEEDRERGKKVLIVALLAILAFGAYTTVSNWLNETKQVFIERQS